MAFLLSVLWTWTGLHCCERDMSNPWSYHAVLLLILPDSSSCVFSSSYQIHVSVWHSTLHFIIWFLPSPPGSSPITTTNTPTNWSSQEITLSLVPPHLHMECHSSHVCQTHTWTGFIFSENTTTSKTCCSPTSRVWSPLRAPLSPCAYLYHQLFICAHVHIHIHHAVSSQVFFLSGSPTRLWVL